MKNILYLFIITLLGQCHMKKELEASEKDHKNPFELIRDSDLKEFNGLRDEENLSDARAVFSIAEAAVPGSHKIGGTFMDRLKTASGMTTIWLEKNKVLYIQVNEPQLGSSLNEILGEPDAVLDSRLGSATDQHVYFERGISAHISSYDKKIKRIYFFRPMTQKAFLDQAVAKVAITRRRR